jgi:hypothetical protein
VNEHQQLASVLVAASGAMMLSLGSLHLVYTFFGPKLRPRDPALEGRMKVVHPGITRQTTMWKAWVGFNASHSLGCMLFGLLYGYLALAQPAVLFGSTFLGMVGGAFLLGFVALGKAYWFSTSFRGLVLAFILYGGGFAAALA